LVAHPRNGDMQVAGFVELPIADSRVALPQMRDRLDDDMQRLAVPIVARRLRIRGGRKQESTKGEKAESDHRDWAGSEKKEPRREAGLKSLFAARENTAASANNSLIGVNAPSAAAGQACLIGRWISYDATRDSGFIPRLHPGREATEPNASG